MTEQTDEMIKRNTVPDMHAHICDLQNPEPAEAEIRYRRQQGIRTFFSTGTPEEWQFMSRILDPAHLTFGIHPWYSGQWNPSDFPDLFRACRFIGEIGMDTLWCDVPPEIQKKAFAYQLTVAADLRKPVVLHTKNCEKQIAEMIMDFPGNVLVHWYSGDEQTLLRYIDQGCYFTLGPDTSLLQESLLLQHVPADRLLIETDGIGAVQWAYESCGKPLPAESGPYDFSLIPRVLSASVKCMARVKKLSCIQAADQLNLNYQRFAGEAQEISSEGNWKSS